MTKTATTPSIPLWQYLPRLFLTAVGILALAAILHNAFELPVNVAVLAATPGCLMLGSMSVLLHLAVKGDAVAAKEQLTLLLIVEFVIIPLGVLAALVAFFALR